MSCEIMIVYMYLYALPAPPRLLPPLVCVCVCVSPSSCRVCVLPARCKPGTGDPPSPPTTLLVSSTLPSAPNENTANISPSACL